MRARTIVSAYARASAIVSVGRVTLTGHDGRVSRSRWWSWSSSLWSSSSRSLSRSLSWCSSRCLRARSSSSNWTSESEPRTVRLGHPARDHVGAGEVVGGVRVAVVRTHAGHADLDGAAVGAMAPAGSPAVPATRARRVSRRLHGARFPVLAWYQLAEPSRSSSIPGRSSAPPGAGMRRRAGVRIPQPAMSASVPGRVRGGLAQLWRCGPSAPSTASCEDGSFAASPANTLGSRLRVERRPCSTV